MKKLLKISFILFFFNLSCKNFTETISLNQSEKIYQSLILDSIDIKAIKLKENYEQVINASKAEKESLNLIFFNSFPSSFDEMNDLFGYNETREGPLYSDDLKIIKYFSQLDLIDKEAYYNKYIDICINGKWEADNITRGFDIYKRILDDTNTICEVLAKKSDSELESIFRFVFDGPHPDNQFNHKLNNQFMSQIPNKFERLKKHINFSLEILIVENKNGH